MESCSNANTKMCKNCFGVQAIRGEPCEAELSAYDQEFLAMDPVHMARAMLCLVGDMHVKFRGELKRGRYDWFKPVCDSNIEDSMTKANRNLQEIVDNGHLVRGHAPKKFTKEGQIFTYQANDEMFYWMDENTCMREDIDHQGCPYVEYIYDQQLTPGDMDQEEPKKMSSEKWEVSTEKKVRSYNEQEF